MKYIKLEPNSDGSYTAHVYSTEPLSYYWLKGLVGKAAWSTVVELCSYLAVIVFQP